ncbi:hypothetical protein [Gordonia shandongensis]|uniref:hypothetical protein n=1 Tax=Gordonia shandongensis TaxID=376351 RepID=UPI000429EF24|nr:hypothetical protein [Gordonia shandongensis]
MPLMIVVYALLITLSMRDSVSSQTLVSTAWLLIACVYAISCLPDILVSWWTQDPDDEFPDPRTPTRRTPTRRTPP